ncbi:Hypp2629 [Branchiostoma lanceolatum]|uniref:Hypp2629 protein n=1 Tax=Branchiostoma lanceolatum TaxID=7740 RepID=A0A8J9ZW55_BRALA|nr:Hypp2629 [Branchiostoma lanceolatum]
MVWRVYFENKERRKTRPRCHDYPEHGDYYGWKEEIGSSVRAYRLQYGVRFPGTLPGPGPTTPPGLPGSRRGGQNHQQASTQACDLQIIRSAFEVYVNKKLYYSMLEKRQFPHINQLVREIKKHLSEAKAQSTTADLGSEALPSVTTKQLSPA